MGNDEQREDLANKGWRAGETFFDQSGGRPAQPAGADGSEQGTGGGDSGLPASEAGAGIIPEGDDQSSGAGHLPASEADDGALRHEGEGETQSWPGAGGPGSFPPPG